MLFFLSNLFFFFIQIHNLAIPYNRHQQPVDVGGVIRSMKASLRRAQWTLMIDIVQKMEMLYQDIQHYTKIYSNQSEFLRCGFQFDPDFTGDHKLHMHSELLRFLLQTCAPEETGEEEYKTQKEKCYTKLLMWAEVAPPGWPADQMSEGEEEGSLDEPDGNAAMLDVVQEPIGTVSTSSASGSSSSSSKDMNWVSVNDPGYHAGDWTEESGDNMVDENMSDEDEGEFEDPVVPT